MRLFTKNKQRPRGIRLSGIQDVFHMTANHIILEFLDDNHLMWLKTKIKCKISLILWSMS